MRVVQVIHALHIGGAERVVIDLARHLDRDGFEPHVLCLREPGVLAESVREEGIPVTVVPRCSGRSGVLRTVREALVALRPDIIHSHGIPSLMGLGPLGMLRRLPAPVVHTFHFGNYPHIRRRYLWGERLFARFMDRLVAVSDSQRRTISRTHYLAANRIGLCNNGVADNPHMVDGRATAALREQLGVPQGCQVVGCMVTLTPQKGVTHLIEAARQLQHRRDSLRILVVGGGPLEPDLRRQAADAGLDDFVIFAGWQNQGQRFLPLLDVYVLPSLWEAMPIGLLEAMAARRPIVVTDVADNASWVGHGERGRIVPPADPQALARAIEALLDDPDHAAALGAAAREYWAETLTVAAMCRRYEQIYREVAGVEWATVTPSSRHPATINKRD